MTQTSARDLLIASLTELADAEAEALTLSSGAYFDWSMTGSAGVSMEISEGNAADSASVQVQMTRDDMLALQQRLTLWLLSH